MKKILRKVNAAPPYMKCFINLKILILISFSIALCCSASARIHFTQHCEIQTLKLINRSKSTIDIAVYSVNNSAIVNALLEAYTRGVKIRLLTDRIQSFGKTSKARFLKERGIDIKIHSNQKIMHHKFAVFDGKKAIEGSFNWTASAATVNAEDCNVFNKETDVKELRKRFRKLWKLNSYEASECYFSNMELAKENREKCSVKMK